MFSLDFGHRFTHVNIVMFGQSENGVIIHLFHCKSFKSIVITLTSQNQHDLARHMNPLQELTSCYDTKVYGPKIRIFFAFRSVSHVSVSIPHLVATPARHGHSHQRAAPVPVKINVQVMCEVSHAW